MRIFRGKQCRGEWVYGDLVHVVHADGTTEYTIKPYKSGRATAVGAESVGIFTGLYDVDNVPIYEGDMLRHTETSDVYIVRYHAPRFVKVGESGVGELPSQEYLRQYYKVVGQRGKREANV